MVYLKNEKYLPKDATLILSLSRNILHDDKIIIRDVRVASHFLELDISIATSSGIGKIKSKLSQIAPILDIDRIIEKELDKIESIKNIGKRMKFLKVYGNIPRVMKETC